MHKDVLIVADYSHIEPLTAKEVCDLFHIDASVLHELVDNDIAHPHGSSAQDWAFSLAELPRMKRALRLQHDLEIPFHAIAVLLDVLEQMDEMRAHMEILKRHYF